MSITLFAGWLVQSCSTARVTSRRFVTAVRERRLAEARALAGPSLAPLLGDGQLPAALSSVQTSSSDDLGIVQLGFAGYMEPFACFDGTLHGSRKYWIVARQQRDGWRVVELADQKPKSCEGAD